MSIEIRGRGTRAALAVGVAFAVAIVALGLSAASAFGARGHTFSFAFGSSGKGQGQFGSPFAVAVNEQNGHVYVSDRTNNRVEEFEPVTTEGAVTGEKFVREFAVPSPEFIAVDNATGSPSQGDVYVAGTTAAKAKAAEKAKLVAEDGIVYKFNAEGTKLAELKKFKPTEPQPEEEAEPKFEHIEGLAVDTAGNLYIYDFEGVADVFSNASPENIGRFSIESAYFNKASPGLALDSEANLYVGHVSSETPVIAKLEKKTGNTLIEEFDSAPSSSVAVDRGEGNEVFIAHARVAGGKSSGSIASFGPTGAAGQRFGSDHLSEAGGVGVDSTTHLVYVTDPASGDVAVFVLEAAGAPTVDSLSSCTAGGGSSCPSAAGTEKLNAQVDPHGADTHAYFEYGGSACSSAPGTCAKSPETDLGGGFGDQPLSVELAGLAPGIYHYRVVASNSFGTVESAEKTFAIAATFAALPDGRQWEMVSPPNKDGSEPESITKEGGTIQAAATGGAISYVADGPIPANGEPEGNRNLEYTQVISVRSSSGWSSQDISTPHTYGTGVEPGREEYRAFSENLALGLVVPFPGAHAATPLAQPPLSPPEEYELEGKKVTEAKQEKTAYLRADKPLAPQGGAEAADYEKAEHNGEKMHNAGYLPLVTEATVPGGPKACFEAPSAPCFGGGRFEGVEAITGTPDMTHVLLESYKAAPGLYMWGGEPLLQQVSVLPNGSPAPTAPNFPRFGQGHDVRNAISEDGSLVYWEEPLEEVHLYVRNTVTHKTMQVDEVAPGASGGTKAAATFQAASADGSRVFFSDTQRLTPDSHAGQFTVAGGSTREPDLYVFELGQTNAQPGCSLTPSGRVCDLTAEGVNGESGWLLEQGGPPNSGGGVVAASKDGTTVYFVTNGALTEGSPRGNCTTTIGTTTGRKCNLYMRHYNGSEWVAPKLIGSLSNEDANDWGGAHNGFGELRFVTSRVSPNGRYLAFMSREKLTGYNNEDVSSKAPGERMDEEVFLYDTQTESLVCASCNPSGARPAGVFDPGATNEGGAGEGIGLLVDRVGAWAAGEPMVDHWLAGSVPGWTSNALSYAVYQSRYLSDNGRLFFNSSDHLVAAATGPKNKVFEYEPNHLGSCGSEGGCLGMISSGESEHESGFLDASEGGNEVFFLTESKLTSQDVDTNFDIYDAHICESSSPCTTPPPPPPPPCQETPELPCKGPAPSLPSFSAPASAGITVSGNVVPGAGGVLPSKTSQPPPKPKPETKAQKLAKALKACRKKYKNKHKRQVCERTARKKYGSAKKAAVKR